MDLCLKPDITTFASGFAFTLEGERPGLKLPQENIIPGPPQRALLLPATFTGSVGLFYMACRQILKDYIKKLERERFEADLKEAQDVLAHMGSRLQDLEHNDQSVVELDAEMGHMIDALHEVEADFENLVRTHSRMLERTDSATSKPDKA